MVLLYWIAAAWLAAATVVTLAFLSAKRSHRIHAWLFGDRPSEVRRMLPHANLNTEPAKRLAA